MAVPMTSPTNMSPLLMAAPGPGPRTVGPGPHVQGAFPVATSAEGRRIRAPPGVRDERAVAAASPVGSPGVGERPAVARQMRRDVRRCRLTPEVFTGGQEASRSVTERVGAPASARPPPSGRCRGHDTFSPRGTRPGHHPRRPAHRDRRGRTRPGHPEPRAPRDFVALHSVDPTILHEIRYVTPHNFTGERIDGYRQPLCILTRPAAEALRTAQRRLLPQGYSSRCTTATARSAPWTTSSAGPRTSTTRP